MSDVAGRWVTTVDRATWELWRCSFKLRVPKAPSVHTVFGAVTIFICIATGLWLLRLLIAPEFGLKEPKLHFNSAQPMTMALHGFAGVLMMLLGLVQISSHARQRLGSLHKRLGYVFMGVTCLMVASALFLHPKSSEWGVDILIPTGGVFSLVCGIIGVRAARAGDIGPHRKWMLRCFAAAWIGFSLRLYYVVLGDLLSVPFHPRYVLATWLATLTNIVFIEVYLYTTERNRRVKFASAETR